MARTNASAAIKLKERDADEHVEDFRKAEERACKVPDSARLLVDTWRKGGLVQNGGVGLARGAAFPERRALRPAPP